MEQKHDIVLYQIDDTNVCVSVYFENETFWLTTKAMAELFGVKSQAITKHLGNIYEEEELTREATCSKKEQVQIEGGREVKRNLDFYNLDAISQMYLNSAAMIMISIAKPQEPFMHLCRISFISPLPVRLLLS